MPCGRWPDRGSIATSNEGMPGGGRALGETSNVEPYGRTTRAMEASVPWLGPSHQQLGRQDASHGMAGPLHDSRRSTTDSPVSGGPTFDERIGLGSSGHTRGCPQAGM